MMPLTVLKCVLVVCLVCSLFNHVVSDPTYFQSDCYTGVGNYTQNSTYQKNLNLTLANLTAQSSVSSFYNLTVGEGLDRVYALFYCRADILTPECHACIQDAASVVVQKCPIAKEAVIWYEECTLHYANRSIFSSEEERPWGYYNSSNNVSISIDGFEQILLSTMGGLVKTAAYKSAQGFATGEVNITALQKMYCLVQCSPDILGAPCETCLDAALRDMPSYCGVGRVWTMLYQPSCQLRYDLAPFYEVDRASSLSSQSISASQGKRGFSLIFDVAVPVLFGAVFILCCLFLFLYHMKMERKLKGLGPLSLRPFTYRRLASATDGFSTDRLLGQGGFGHVYKGVLPDNRVVAVKKLKEGSFQGELEFLSEIQIISRVHHRNLVSLVGYCISGSRKLLVYEFVTNNSLDRHLHGSDSLLDWPTRKKIAVGAAKGLAYLHEDCLPRIIHRDIKSTNILLDSNFEAKVADFGLARIFADSKTHITTDVKGTPGYLAPEYQTSGMLTEKSDVFSFGIVLLELITGRKPTYLLDWARPLLARALQDGILEPLVDPKLENGYVNEDMTRMVVCAALCVHSSADHRLKMIQVVQLLEGILSVESFAEHAQMSENASSISTLNPHRLDLDDLRRWAFGMQEQVSGTGGWSWSTSENTPHAPDISHVTLQMSGNVTNSTDLYPNNL